MVEEELTDGRRIAQLLSSEVTGRADGVMGALSVVDADTGVTPTADGAPAFAIALESTGGEPREDQNATGATGRLPHRVATVVITPDAAIAEFADGIEVATEAVPARADLAWDEEAGRLLIERGAAVKVALDVLRSTADEAQTSRSGQ